jgi:hypothetical protein
MSSEVPVVSGVKGVLYVLLTGFSYVDRWCTVCPQLRFSTFYEGGRDEDIARCFSKARDGVARR